MQIYNLIIFEADLVQSVFLGALTSMTIILLLSYKFKFHSSFYNISNVTHNFYKNSNSLIIWIIFILFFAYFIAPYLFMIVGFTNFSLDKLFNIQFWNSVFISFIVGSFSAFIGLLVTISAFYFTDQKFNHSFFRSKFTYIIIFIISSLPAISLASIIYALNIKLNFLLNEFFLMIIMNGLFCLPIIFILSYSQYISQYDVYRKICLNNDLKDNLRFHYILLPKLKSSLFVGFLIALLLSLGDLTSITIFNTSQFQTAPYFISSLYSSYKYYDAFFYLSLYVLCIIIIISITNFIYKNVKN